MSDKWAQAEAERILANLIRVGTVAELDAANARVKINVSGLTTDWLPWTTSRAGATRTWSAPRAGEQVLLLAPHGDLAQGVVVPSIYQDDHPAPADSQDKETTVYPDGSTVEYNSASNTLTVTVADGGNVVINCKHATINAENDATINTETATISASASTTIDSPATTVTGTLTVQGLLTYQAGITGSGGGTFTGNFAASGGTFTHNSVNVGSTHHHSGVQTGVGDTGNPH